MKRQFFAFLLVTLCTTVSAVAQNDNDRRRERRNDMDLAEIYNRQAARLVRQMKLKDDKKDLFTVLYLDYQNARHNAVNPTGGDQEGNEMRVDLDNISDDDALELIQKNFDRQEKQLAVDKEYLPKFLEILTPAQATRVFINRPGRPEGAQGARGQGGRGGGRGGFGGPGGGFGGPGGGF